jgi:sortase B
MVRARDKKKYHIKTRRLIFAALFFLFAAVGIVAAVNLIITQNGSAVAQKEYDALRQYAPEAAPLPQSEQTAAIPPAQEPETPQNLFEINPDYTCWIRIDGTGIDYPVARGEDNEKYLSTTFMCESNKSGAIFMDSRCTDGFDGLAILYGHNMKDGTMFAGLNRYCEDGYLAENPDITVITRDGETLVYRIFAVRVTDITDMTYTLPDKDWEARESYMAALDSSRNVERALVLSTCVSGGNEDERLLVFAAAE